MFLGKRVRVIAVVLLVALSCQMILAGSNLESIYHTTNGERTTVILRGAASVPYVIHKMDDQTILIDLPGATTYGLRPQYRVDSPAVQSIEMEQVTTPSGQALARMRVHLNTRCEVVPVAHDGLLTFSFAPGPKASSSPMPVSRVNSGHGATVVNAVGAVTLTEGVVGFIDADGPMQYRHFATTDGTRVVVDVTGVQDVTTRKAVNVDTNLVKVVRVGQFSTVAPLVTRVVFEVSQPSAYTFQQDGNRLLVKFSNSTQGYASGTAPALPIAEVATQSGQQPPVTDDKKPKLNKKTDDQTGTDVKTGPPPPPGTTPLSGVSQDGQGSTTTKKPGRDTSFDSKNDSGSGLRVTVDNPTFTPMPQSRTNSVSTGNSQDSYSNPNSDQAQNGGELKYGNPRFSGDPLDLNLKGVDIREVTNLIAANFSVNFVYDRSVGAVPVTVNLTGVPWNMVLDQLLKANDLASSVDGPVVRILSTAKLEIEELSKKKLKDAWIATQPLETRIVRLQYARADGSSGGSGTSASQTASSLAGGSSGGSSGGSGLRAILLSRLSTRGRVETDPRTNSLIVTDVREYLDAALDMVAQIDRPERQVEIELRIVRVNSDFNRDLGNQFAASGANLNRNGLGSLSTLSPAAATTTTTGTTPTGIIPTLLGGVKSPSGTLGAAAANSVLSLTTGAIGTGIITNVLTANESLGKVKIISSPRITAQNNQTAEVESGTKIPVSTNSNNTITTIYISASLRLQITPMITDTNEVQLKIIAENDQPLFGNRDQFGNIAISTQRAETTVRVPDGGTTIFGGVAVNSDSKTEFRTPGVSKIPILGELFKRRQTEVTNDEILFFVTPRITKPQLNGLEDFLPPDKDAIKVDKPNPTLTKHP